MEGKRAKATSRQIEEESDSDSSEISIFSTASSSISSKRKGGRMVVWQEKLTWSTSFVQMRKQGSFLFFRALPARETLPFIRKPFKQLQDRLAERGDKFPHTVVQMRNKFKKCVSVCKHSSPTIKKASGI